MNVIKNTPNEHSKLIFKIFMVWLKLRIKMSSIQKMKIKYVTRNDSKNDKNQLS
ncbi:hypothetical protein ACW5YJ_10355 [Staphylococcus sp. mip270_02]